MSQMENFIEANLSQVNQFNTGHFRMTMGDRRCFVDVLLWPACERDSCRCELL